MKQPSNRSAPRHELKLVNPAVSAVLLLCSFSILLCSFSLPVRADDQRSKTQPEGVRTERQGANQPAQQAANAKPDSGLSDLEKHAFELINRDRAKFNSPPVVLNQQLSKLAHQHAQDMAEKKYFSHISPDGRNPEQRAQDAGIKCGVYENIALDEGNEMVPMQAVEELQASFMSEPPNQENHRYIILLPKNKFVGVSVVTHDDRILLVQEYTEEDPATATGD